MIDNQAVELINRELELAFGKDPAGRSLFRLAWANEEFETRRRVLVKLDNSGNYLGEEEQVAVCHKYPMALNCLVLEKSLIGEGVVPTEVKTWNGYEMVWNFKNMKTQEPQNPSLTVCKFIAASLLYGPTKTVQDYYDEDKQAFDAEVEEFFQELDSDSPYLATMLHNREAVVVPGRDEDA